MRSLAWAIDSAETVAAAARLCTLRTDLPIFDPVRVPDASITARPPTAVVVGRDATPARRCAGSVAALLAAAVRALRPTVDTAASKFARADVVATCGAAERVAVFIRVAAFVSRADEPDTDAATVRADARDAADVEAAELLSVVTMRETVRADVAPPRVVDDTSDDGVDATTRDGAVVAASTDDANINTGKKYAINFFIYFI